MQKKRNPIFAGRFYENNKNKLLQHLEQLFQQAKPKILHHVQAIISPHAGYIFSGQTAASAFNQIDKDKNYENIFIIAPSHHFNGHGIALFSGNLYETPLGELQINTELQNYLLLNYPEYFYVHDETHFHEHSLEVQLPFLQYHISNYKYIVPLIITTHNIHQIKNIAECLQPYFNDNNLFIISTDWSHYPTMLDAENIDKETIQIVVAKKPFELYELLNQTNDIDNLYTRMCGSNAVLLLLFLSSDKHFTFSLIEYSNSAQSPYGDEARVVGYAAIAVYKDTSFLILNENEQKELLAIARNTLEHYLSNEEKPDITPNSENLKKPYGAFVSIYYDNQLRGCLGHFITTMPLYKTIQELTIASATRDFRFNPVELHELPHIKLEISVLSELKKIDNIKEIVLGKHGIYIKKGNRSGTFLPQVASKTGWSLEEFLGHCSEDKAGLGWDGWKDAEIYIYEAQIIKEY
ncbi:MAG: AmmeMemoRadiSam system protein B [Bacteroidales bacterium]|nr:AmmeMemoRadiSam system protein B [Bacteroidales bacterium]